MRYFVDIDGVYKGGLGEGLPVPDGWIEVPSAPSHAKQWWDGSQWSKIYRIYELAINRYEHWSRWPGAVDFITGLTQRLQPQNTFEYGELQQTIYYIDASLDQETGVVTYDLPVVKEQFSYTRDPETGFPVYRENVISWYFTDGTIDDVNTKALRKFYVDDPVSCLTELATRRDNNIKNIIGAMIPLVLATEENMTRNEVIDAGRDFFNSVAEHRQTYILDGNQALVDDVRNDTTLTFLDNDIQALVGLPTIRSFVIYQLTMGQETE